MIYIDLILSILFGIFGVIFKAMADIIDHHYYESVFSEWDFFRHDWKHKYNHGIPELGRRKWFGFIPIPLCFIDGWHLAGYLRYLCQALCMYFALNWVFGLYGLYISMLCLGIILFLAAIRNYSIHKLFYNHLFYEGE